MFGLEFDAIKAFILDKGKITKYDDLKEAIKYIKLFD